MNRALPLLALTALSLAACEPTFTPGSVLDGLRVLAVEPDPPDAAPGEQVTVRALTYAAPGDPVAAERWSFCPLTAGASSGYRCVAAACEYDLGPGSGGAISADPSALALRCLQDVGGAVPGGAAPPPQLETVFRYTVRAASGASRSAVARLPLYTSAAAVPADRNLAPVITGVRLAGAPATAGQVAVTARPGDVVPLEVDVDPSSLQPYVDANGHALTESVVVQFYTSAGRFPDGQDRDLAPVARTQLELRELRATDAEADLYAVARDLRGGQAFVGPFRVAIARGP